MGKTTAASQETIGGENAPAEQIIAFAGRCNVNGHDKIWAAAVVGCDYKSLYGATGSTYKPADKPFLTHEKAKAHYIAKYTSKTNGSGDVYTQVDFNNPLQGNIPFLFPEQGDSGAIISAPAEAKESVYTTAHVQPMDEAALDAALSSRAYALSEKVNEKRSILAFDGAQLRAYNRKGHLLAAAPLGAQPLVALGHPFVLDGEWMYGGAQNTYIVFDVLEWNGTDMHPTPYRRRIAVLEGAFASLGLAHMASPSIETMEPNSLYLLTGEADAAKGRALAQRVLERGGEKASSSAPSTRPCTPAIPMTSGR